MSKGKPVETTPMDCRVKQEVTENSSRFRRRCARSLKDFLWSLGCGEQVFRGLYVQAKGPLTCDNRTLMFATAVSDAAPSVGATLFRGLRDRYCFGREASNPSRGGWMG
jgi:hypothetical protein